MVFGVAARVLAMAVKGAKPVIFCGAVGMAGFGYRKWDEASKVLMLDYMSDSEVDRLFDRIDADHSGAISEEELRKALGLTLDNFTLHAMIVAADCDNNGEIDRKEFRDLVHRIQKDHHTEYHRRLSDDKTPSQIRDVQYNSAMLKAEKDQPRCLTSATELRIKRRAEPSPEEKKALSIAVTDELRKNK